MASHIERRKFLATLGGAAAAWPFAARAQQPAIPVVGILSSGSISAFTHLLGAFRQGLKETGYLEGQNVAIETHWAEGRFGIAGCCARAPSGQAAAAPPSSVMNSRRLIQSPRRQAIASSWAPRCRAPWPLAG
jgi:hypothetical protein